MSNCAQDFGTPCILPYPKQIKRCLASRSVMTLVVSHEVLHETSDSDS